MDVAESKQKRGMPNFRSPNREGLERLHYNHLVNHSIPLISVEMGKICF